MLFLPRIAYAQAGLSNWFCSSVVVVVCHKKFRKIFLTGDLEAVAIAKLELTAEIFKILTCVYLIVTKMILVCVCPALSYLTTVRSAILLRSRIEYDRGRAYATHVHTEVYVEKCPCHYYGDQPRLQFVYGVTRAQYTNLHAVSSLQHPGARAMSLLETSSVSKVMATMTFSLTLCLYQMQLLAYPHAC